MQNLLNPHNRYKLEVKVESMAARKKIPTLKERVDNLETRMDQMKEGLQQVLDLMERMVE
jgi:cell division protein FtsB